MLLVQLMDELKMDVGPESQDIHITLSSYDTFAYVVTTFAVNGYETKIEETPNPVMGTKYMTGKIRDDGWSISLWVLDVPLDTREVEEAERTRAEDDGAKRVPRRGGRQQGEVHGSGAEERTGTDTGADQAPTTKRTRRTRTNNKGVDGGGTEA